MKKVKVVPKRDYDINVTDTENDNNGGAGAAGQLDSESGSPPATKSEVLESTARYSDSFSEEDVAEDKDSPLINFPGGFGSDALGDAAEAPPSTTTATQLLGPTQASAMVVNYISMGYVLLPYGKQENNAWSSLSHDHPRHI